MDFIIMPVLNVDGYVYTWKGVKYLKSLVFRDTENPNFISP